MNIGYIYKIKSPTSDLVYYGSTIQSLKRRLSKHKSDYKRWLSGKGRYTTSGDIIKLQNAEIHLIETFDYSIKKELTDREAYFIKKFECVNKVIPGRTRKIYQQENKVKIKEQMKIYHQENKESINKKQKIYKKNNKEKIKEYNKIYHQQNKKSINKESKIYWKQNREQINEKKKIYDRWKAISKEFNSILI